MNLVDETARALHAQLARLDRLALDDAEKVAAECDRATAVNNTCRNVIGLGELYMRAQMLQMSKPGAEFDGGLMFPPAKPQPAAQPPFGGRTKVNALGEFVSDDGADAFTGSVEGNTEWDSRKEPDHA